MGRSIIFESLGLTGVNLRNAKPANTKLKSVCCGPDFLSNNIDTIKGVKVLNHRWAAVNTA